MVKKPGGVGMQLKYYFEEEPIILIAKPYEGPVTLNLLPFNVLQLMFFQVVINRGDGHFSVTSVIYQMKEYAIREFIGLYPKIMEIGVLYEKY